MELYQLRTFVAVAEEGNFTRGGKRVHATQPAVSAHIKALEQELGIRLFVRTPRGVELTDAGTALVGEAEGVLNAAESLLRKAETFRGELSGTVSIGLCTTPGYLRVGELLAHMAEHHPRLKLRLSQSPTVNILQDMEEKRLDAGFVFWKTSRHDLETLPLARPEYHIVGPASWKETLDTAGAEELSSLPWVTTPEGSLFQEIQDYICKKHGIAPEHTIGADSEELIRQIIIAGKGLAIMRDDEAEELKAAGHLAICRSLGSYPVDVGFAYRAAKRDDPALRALLEGVKAVWNVE
ncbi:LysR family transcriptional regulator [Pseudodesulfovibrio tunisiensis]|uniref:LysR family transcriptional regulator n=1 Tax=Pseudodesulfovibrio tunisiensis TaxID=463192 RepID=UPI001FB218B4|nr:LysR family transcriptional regulator [Pseudodesulfovibrio tunisiensis]